MELIILTIIFLVFIAITGLGYFAFDYKSRKQKKLARANLCIQNESPDPNLCIQKNAGIPGVCIQN